MKSKENRFSEMSHYSLMFVVVNGSSNLVDCIIPSTLKPAGDDSICVTTQQVVPTAVGKRNFVMTKTAESIITINSFDLIVLVDNFTLNRFTFETKGKSPDDIVDEIVTCIDRLTMLSLTGVYDFTMHLFNGDTINTVCFGSELRLIDSLLYIKDKKINLNQIDSVNIICKWLNGSTSWHRLCKPVDEMYDYFDCFCPRANGIVKRDSVY